MSNPCIGGVFLASLIFSAFSAPGLEVSDTAGTWRVISFSMPSRLTPHLVQGVVNGISGAQDFENSTGSLNVSADGTFTGLVPDPITGTFALGGQGQLMVNVNGEDGPQTLTFHINRTGDFMATCRVVDDLSELIVALRAPATLAPADLAGNWNAVGFASPYELVLERNSSNHVINIDGLNNFGVFGGDLTINADGTLSGNIDGPFTGMVESAANGIVNLIVNEEEGPEPHDLFVNANKDVMALLQSRFDAEDNFQEIMIFQKAPTNNVTRDLEGHWRIVTYNAPRLTQITDAQGRVTGLGGPNRFEALRQHLVMGYDGFFTAQVGDTATGTMTPAASGLVAVDVQSSGDGPETFTLQLNSRQTLLSTARAISDGYDLMLFTQSAPIPGPLRDFGLVSMPNLTDLTLHWAASTNGGLQTSTNLSDWQTLAPTIGQHSYTAPASAAPSFYRVVKLTP